MSTASNLEAAIASNASAIASYSAKLASEAVAPKATYNIDGENVSYNEWRLSILEMIKGLTEANAAMQQLLNSLSPYAIATRHRV